MTKSKLLTRICTAAMSLMMLVSVTAITASAKNYKDTTYSYSLDNVEQSSTEFRKKEDNSSCYMYCKQSNGTYDAYVITGPEEGGCIIDISNGHHYRFQQGTKRYMFNYVNEGGYTICAIAAYTSTNGLVASGLWSPDSVWQSSVLPGTDYIK